MGQKLSTVFGLSAVVSAGGYRVWQEHQRAQTLSSPGGYAERCDVIILLRSNYDQTK